MRYWRTDPIALNWSVRLVINKCRSAIPVTAHNEKEWLLVRHTIHCWPGCLILSVQTSVYNGLNQLGLLPLEIATPGEEEDVAVEEHNQNPNRPWPDPKVIDPLPVPNPLRICSWLAIDSQLACRWYRDLLITCYWLRLISNIQLLRSAGYRALHVANPDNT